MSEHQDFAFVDFVWGEKTEPLVVRELRSFSQTLRFQRKIAKTDVATKKSRRVKQYGVILARNSFQKIKNFDPNKHTYEDLFHWFALGLTKYLALEAKKSLKDKEGEKFVKERIAKYKWAAFTRSLKANPVRNTLSLYGCDFMVLAQIGWYIYDKLLPDSHVELWKMLGKLCAVLYSTEGIKRSETDKLQKDLESFVVSLTNEFPHLS